MRTDPEHLARLERWLRSYRPEELFDDAGARRPRSSPPSAGSTSTGRHHPPTAGLLLPGAALPPLEKYAVPVDEPGASTHEATRSAGRPAGGRHGRHRRLGATSASSAPTRPPQPPPGRLRRQRQGAGRNGRCPSTRTSTGTARVMEILSEHTCPGLAGGLPSPAGTDSSPATRRSSTSSTPLVNQRIEVAARDRRLPWRAPIASLNCLSPPTCPAPGPRRFLPPGLGLVDHIINKSPEAVLRSTCRRTPTPCSPSPTTPCAAATYINVVVAGKRPTSTGCPWNRRGALRPGRGIWDWAGAEDGSRDPDVVLACAGDVPTQEVPSRRPADPPPPARPRRTGGQRRGHRPAAAPAKNTRTA